jgi:hypothetical protein
MLRRTFLAGLTGLSIAAFAAVPASADQWVLLGQQSVGLSADRDIFHVGGEEGRFNALRFRVMGNRVAVAEVRVFYGDGTSEYLNVREHLMPGQFSPSYDLRGVDRVVRRVEVLYQTEHRFIGNATFQVYGLRHTAGPVPLPGGWVTLGTVRANLTLDRDTILVGPSRGTFRTLRFHVTNRPIHLFDIRVTFGSGASQVYNYNRHINAGAWSVPLDLAGDHRVISQIDIVYRKDLSWPGDARLTIQGHH